eukprot:TRINITY_DN1650_c0_g1_i1.p1 TRINITY_DN1650_c0_g1~~TRINITY_DN1650_c0_g1_i1.p1  ORF type:complete len:184 (-),score=22.32 TRINITY_DN1650_c0_g1_i1:66-617(-)
MSSSSESCLLYPRLECGRDGTLGRSGGSGDGSVVGDLMSGNSSVEPRKAWQFFLKAIRALTCAAMFAAFSCSMSLSVNVDRLSDSSCVARVTRRLMLSSSEATFCSSATTSCIFCLPNFRTSAFSASSSSTRCVKDRLRISSPQLSWDSGCEGNLSTISSTTCLLYTSPSPRDRTRSRMPSSA